MELGYDPGSKVWSRWYNNGKKFDRRAKQRENFRRFYTTFMDQTKFFGIGLQMAEVGRDQKISGKFEAGFGDLDHGFNLTAE